MSRAQLTSTVEQNSAGAASSFVAGKNKIINGDFGVWQRGTSFSNPASLAYTADRFKLNFDGTGATRTISQQTFTPGTAPVSGYESAYFLRYACTVAGTGNTFYDILQPIEDVRTFAGQTVTLSFWAKASASVALSRLLFDQGFGSGGSSDVYTTIGTAPTLTTSWVRYTFTFAVPSISGKTIGTGSYANVFIGMPINTTATVDLWGIQIEAGSVATPFTTASGTFQGELALCQRYFWAVTGNSYWRLAATGFAYSSTAAAFIVQNPVTMRAIPSSMTYTALGNSTGQISLTSYSSGYTITALNLDGAASTPYSSFFTATGSSGLTTNAPYFLGVGNGSSAYIWFSAEL